MNLGDMVLAMLPVEEAFVTLVARPWPVLGVISHVVTQLGLNSESFAANFADNRFFSAVLQDMVFKA